MTESKYACTERRSIIIEDCFPPSRVIEVCYYKGAQVIPGTIVKIHYDGKKLTYDIHLWLPCPEKGEKYTRLYNVDAEYVYQLHTAPGKPIEF